VLNAADKIKGGFKINWDAPIMKSLLPIYGVEQTNEEVLGDEPVETVDEQIEVETVEASEQLPEPPAEIIVETDVLTDEQVEQLASDAEAGEAQ
jgi:hypothetical protein